MFYNKSFLFWVKSGNLFRFMVGTLLQCDPLVTKLFNRSMKMHAMSLFDVMIVMIPS